MKHRLISAVEDALDVEDGQLVIRLDQDDVAELASSLRDLADLLQDKVQPEKPKPRPAPPQPTAVFSSSTADGWTDPTGGRIDLSADAADWADRLGFSIEGLELTVFEPDDSWPIPGRGSLMCLVRGDVAVFAYMDATPKIVAAKPSSKVSRPEGSSARRGGGGSHRAARRFSSPKEMAQEMRDRGFIVELMNGGHFRVTHSQSREVMNLPASPSDHRWDANCTTEAKMKFGIDISRPGDRR